MISFEEILYSFLSLSVDRPSSKIRRLQHGSNKRGRIYETTTGGRKGEGRAGLSWTVLARSKPFPPRELVRDGTAR